MKSVLNLLSRLVPAFLMGQTLFFKFSGAAESVYIFQKISMEPWGRWGVGVLELLSVVLLLFGKTAWLGALLATGLMLGAITMHLTVLGIEVQGDDGLLFFYACVVLFCALFVLFQNKHKIQNEVIPKFFKR